MIRREYHVFIFIICHPSTASYSNLNEKAMHFTDYLSETEAVLRLQLQFYFPLFLKDLKTSWNSFGREANSVFHLVPAELIERNRTKNQSNPIEPNRSIGVRLVRQSTIIELELLCEFD